MAFEGSEKTHDGDETVPIPPLGSLNLAINDMQVTWRGEDVGNAPKKNLAALEVIIKQRVAAGTMSGQVGMLISREGKNDQARRCLIAEYSVQSWGASSSIEVKVSVGDIGENIRFLNDENLLEYLSALQIQIELILEDIQTKQLSEGHLDGLHKSIRVLGNKMDSLLEVISEYIDILEENYCQEHVKVLSVRLLRHDLRNYTTNLNTVKYLFEKGGDLSKVQTKLAYIMDGMGLLQSLLRVSDDQFTLESEILSGIIKGLPYNYAWTPNLNVQVEPGEYKYPAVLTPLLFQLVNNAFKFSDPQTRLNNNNSVNPEKLPPEVSISTDQNKLIIKVIDHGIGIPADQIAAIKNRVGGRGDNVAGLPGSGKGLIAVLKLVDKIINFNLDITSNTSSTVFTLELQGCCHAEG